jgi:hypothetical protein
MMTFDLKTREMRKRLTIRDKPYYVRITAALHLGYRKSKSINRWLIRTRTASGYRTQVIRDVVPDDRLKANGASILSYQQAIIWAMNMHPDENVQNIECCGFCGKSQPEIKTLIAGPNTHICDECVVLCGQIISEHAERAVESAVDA